MEPIEIFGAVAEAFAVAGHALKIAKTLHEAFNSINEAREDVVRAADIVRLMQSTLDGLQKELHKRTAPFPWEETHHKAILNVLKNCRDDLERLQKGLSQDSERLSGLNNKQRGKLRTFVQSIPLALTRYMREDERIFDRLLSALDVINWSIVTVSAPITWKIPRQHEETLQAIRCLPTSLNKYARAHHLLRGSPLYFDNELDEDALEDSIAADSEKNKKVTRDILVWANSAIKVTDYVATETIDLGVASITPTELDATTAAEECEPFGNHLARPWSDQLQWQYKLAIAKVDQLESLSLPFHASIYQRKGVRFREELQSGYGIPFPPNDKADMEEKLSDILLSCDIPECTHDALTILERLSQNLKSASTEDNYARKLRILHKIGKTYLRSDVNDAPKSFHFLYLALIEYSEKSPRDVGKVNEIFELYSKAGHMSNNKFKVDSTQMMLRHKMQGEFHLLRHKPLLALHWCQKNGFEVDENRPLVPFDQLRDSRNNTPFHVAARDQRIGEHVLRDLLSEKESLDGLDGNNDSALFVALEVSNPLTVRLLLDFGANVHFQHPKTKQTALHKLQRCQDDEVIEAVFNKFKGGKGSVSLRDSMIGPTEVSTNDPSEAEGATTVNIDTRDWYERTPIQVASKQGNLTLVSRLIAEGANPNLADDSGRTPLLEACSTPMDPSDKRGIISLLVRAGADTKHKDASNQDAEKELRKRTNFKKSEIAALLSGNLINTRSSSLSSGRWSRRTSSSITGTTLESLEPVRTPSVSSPISPLGSLPPVLELPSHHKSDSGIQWLPEFHEMEEKLV